MQTVHLNSPSLHSKYFPLPTQPPSTGTLAVSHLINLVESHISCQFSFPYIQHQRLSPSCAAFLPGTLAVSCLVVSYVSPISFLFYKTSIVWCSSLLPRLALYHQFASTSDLTTKCSLLTIIVMPVNVGLPYVKQFAPGSLLMIDLKCR